MNIMLTSAGRRSYLVKYFKEAIGDQGLVYAGNSAYSPALHYADKNVITPAIYSSDYIKFLINYCKEYSITAIIPLFDIDLPVLAKNKKLFYMNGITVVVSGYRKTLICNDKWKTFNFINKIGLHSPRTYLSLSKVNSDLRNDIIKFPLIVKPRWGMGSIGLYKAENKEELSVFIRKTLRDVEATYLKHESKRFKDKCIIIQEFIDGIEYGLDVVNNFKKEYITTFCKRKLFMRAGETDSAITELNLCLENIGGLISRNLKHIGILDVDCILSKGKPFILEMNARFGGHYPFSHLAGANLPKAYISWLNNETHNSEHFDIRKGVRGIKNIEPIVF